MIVLPEPLETERLVLRCPHPNDAVVVQRAIKQSWPELTPWLHWTQDGLPTVEETVFRAKEAQREWRESVAFHCNLFRKDDGAFVGRASLFDLQWEVPKATIGYWMATRYRGHGYMTEAVALLTELGLETLCLVRLQIDCDARNERSAAVARRLGFPQEAHLKNTGRDAEGNLRDTLIFAKTR